MLKYRIIYYPFMGTATNTERLVLMAKLCYAPMASDEIYEMVHGEETSDAAVGKFVRGLVTSGHMGALEHWHTSFAVEGYSRISSQQNDRHRLIKMFKDPGVTIDYMNAPEEASTDVSQLQQSQRYVAERDFEYITPPSFEREEDFLKRYQALQQEVQELQKLGLSLSLPPEDVRFALTNATETRFVITTNARQLRHMFNLRCCQRAQWEIRELFSGLLSEYKRIAPNIFHNAGASCDDMGYCPEGKMCCGRAPTLDELLARK
jgi:thymidylate synthase (FAD)